MADNNKNAETFALGLIVAAIIYLIFRREWTRLLGGSDGGCSCGGGESAPARGGGGGGGSDSICGKCLDGCAAGASRSAVPGDTGGVLPLGSSSLGGVVAYAPASSGGFSAPAPAPFVPHATPGVPVVTYAPPPPQAPTVVRVSTTHPVLGPWIG